MPIDAKLLSASRPELMLARSMRLALEGHAGDERGASDNGEDVGEWVALPGDAAAATRLPGGWRARFCRKDARRDLDGEP